MYSPTAQQKPKRHGSMRPLLCVSRQALSSAPPGGQRVSQHARVVPCGTTRDHPPNVDHQPPWWLLSQPSLPCPPLPLSVALLLPAPPIAKTLFPSHAARVQPSHTARGRVGRRRARNHACSLARALERLGSAGELKRRGRRGLLLVRVGAGRHEGRHLQQVLLLVGRRVLEHDDARATAGRDGRVPRARQQRDVLLLRSQHARGVVEHLELGLRLLGAVGQRRLVRHQLHVHDRAHVAAAVRHLELAHQLAHRHGRRVHVHRLVAGGGRRAAAELRLDGRREESLLLELAE
eukprot:3675871-Prymnesium_polylepis.1